MNTTLIPGQARRVAKGHPMWCRVYAKLTPAIPTHNGLTRCLGCGADVAAIIAARRPANVAP